MTSAAPPRTIHYPLAAKVVGHLKRDAPYDHRTVEQQLELDDTNPEDSRYYAVMVTGGWAALAFGFLIAMVLISFPVNRLLGAQVAVGWATACLVGGVFCLAGCANAIWHVLWHVPQARRRLRQHGADSDAFKRSMRRSLPGNASLMFQTAVAILVLVLAV
jgi:hypothetical protein